MPDADERTLPATVARCRELEQYEAQLEADITEAERQVEEAKQDLIKAREEHQQAATLLRARIAEARMRNSQVKGTDEREGNYGSQFTTSTVVMTTHDGACYAAQGSAQMELALREQSMAEARSRLAKVQLAAPGVASSSPRYSAPVEDQRLGRERVVQHASVLQRPPVMVTKVPSTVLLQPAPLNVVLQPVTTVSAAVPGVSPTPSMPVMSPAHPAPQILSTGYPSLERRP